jgi:hypothetical protein
MPVDNGIGNTLREARNRRESSLEEAEAATKIRLRYLRAMENEDWDVLPGGSYTRAFIRTYASHLGLDGERLAEEYRRGTSASGDGRSLRVEPAAIEPPRGRRRRISRRALAAAVTLLLIGVLVVVGLAGGGGSGGGGHHRKQARANGQATRAAAPPSLVAVQLVAAGEVWVCLLDASGEPLIDGQILAAGAEEGPFRSKSFAVSFGNGEVSLQVNGDDAEIPPTSSPIGYEIGSDGQLTELGESARPTCT